jgi:hypothetical protein
MRCWARLFVNSNPLALAATSENPAGRAPATCTAALRPAVSPLQPSSTAHTPLYKGSHKMIRHMTIRAFLGRNFRNGRRDFGAGRGGGHGEYPQRSFPCTTTKSGGKRSRSIPEICFENRSKRSWPPRPKQQSRVSRPRQSPTRDPGLLSRQHLFRGDRQVSQFSLSSYRAIPRESVSPAS